MAKEKAKIVKRGKGILIVEVPAYSGDNLVGKANVTIFEETEENLAHVKSVLTLNDVKDLNRQKITDGKNNLRRGTSVMAALKALTKANPKVERIVEMLATQAASGSFDAKALDSIEALLTQNKVA